MGQNERQSREPVAGLPGKPAPTAALKEQALKLGFDLVGVCNAAPPPHLDAFDRWLERGYHGTMAYLVRNRPLLQDPRSLLPGAESIVAVGLNYNQPNPPVEGKPRIARYALGRDYHRVLRGKLRHLAAWIAESHLHSASRACVDSAPILERDFANLAGLGWFGKNTMLINSRRGSWFFLGMLLTTVRFEPDEPSDGGCGTCRECVDACPTGAIVFDDGRWQIDARRCVSYLTIEHRGGIDPTLQPGIGSWTVGCDVCQEVCPFNHPRASQPDRARLTREQDFKPRVWPTLVELAQVDDKDWETLTRGSAARRVGPDQMRRNARINLERAAQAD